MTKRLNLVLLTFGLLFGVPYYWFLIDNSHAAAPSHRLDIASLRTLARSQAGPLPEAIEVECTGFRRVPGNLMVAGSGIKRKLICYQAFRLPVPGGKAIMIDSGITAADAAMIGAEEHFLPLQAKVDRELAKAGIVLATHEHPDHLGALAALGGPALHKAAMLNPAQIANANQTGKLRWNSNTPPAARLPGNVMVAVAPGVVVIPAPNSHTPGSQLIFVMLADGREFLFTGDLSSFAQNWQENRGRSRLLQQFVVPENRAEVFAWLDAIRDLKAQSPGLMIVPGHDFEWLINPENKSGLRIGFSPP